jgi:hypothetical protein
MLHAVGLRGERKDHAVGLAASVSGVRGGSPPCISNYFNSYLAEKSPKLPILIFLDMPSGQRMGFRGEHCSSRSKILERSP